jgi:hypothetical protein
MQMLLFSSQLACSLDASLPWLYRVAFYDAPLCDTCLEDLLLWNFVEKLSHIGHILQNV